MAGDMRVGGVSKTRKSRKLWSLQDRSVMSIHLLKATLAEDGCEEAQLDVAKKLLNGDSNDIPAEAVQSENARLAIYWLVKSSEQGNEEATEMLTECFESGQGMTCQNVLDVKTCINTPINEKLTFKAARILFDKLNNGEEFITTTQLLARLESRKSDRKVSFDQSSTQQSHRQEGFINRNRNKSTSPQAAAADGSPPKTEFDPNRTFIISSPVKDNSVTSDEDSFTYSLETQYLSSYRAKEGVKLTLEDLVKIAAVYNQGQLPPVAINSSSKQNPQRQWKLVTVWNAFILQCIVSSLAFGLITQLHAFFMCLSFLSIWSSYNFFLWRRRKLSFADWTEAFRSVLQHKNWVEEGVASKFSKKYYQPYMLSNVLCLILFSCFGGHSSLKIFAGSLSLFGLVCGKILSPFPSWQLTAVFSIQLVSKYASVVKELSPLNILDVDFTDLVYDSIPSAVYEYFPSDIATTLAYVQVILLLHYLIYSKKGNLVTETLPKMLGGLWLLKIVQWSQESSSYEDYAIVSGAVLCVAILFICIDSNVAVWKIITGFGLAAGIICISYGINSAMSPSTEEINLLDWKDYERNCHRSAWRTQTMAETQINCLLKYENAPVAWTGRISLVNLHNHEKRTWDNKLINIVFELLVNAGLEEASSTSEMANIWKWQNYIPINGFLKQFDNVAPVSVWISTKSLSDFDRTSVIRHILNLRTGDVIEFRGSLTKNLGALKPEVGNVESIKCISCSIAEYGEVVVKSEHVVVTAIELIMKLFVNFTDYFAQHEEV